MDAIDRANNHILEEIAKSFRVTLLLKQWMRRVEALSLTIAFNESMLDDVRKETIKLCCLFFLLQGLTLALFSNDFESTHVQDQFCPSGWIFCLKSVSALVSSEIIWGIRYIMGTGRETGRILEREKKDVRVLLMWIEGLERKGTEFDLRDAMDTFRREKEFRSASQGKGKGWIGKELTTLLLVVVLGFVLGLSHWLDCHSECKNYELGRSYAVILVPRK